MIVTGLSFVPLNRALRNTLATLADLESDTQSDLYDSTSLYLLGVSFNLCCFTNIKLQWLELLSSIVQGVQTKPTMTAKMLVGER